MNENRISRRDFLRVSALTAAGMVAAGCVAPATEAPPVATEAPAATEVPAEAPPAEEVTLEVMTPASEYEGPYREIWNYFESKNPGIKVNVFSINEDTSAAHEAKVAGGYLPHMENTEEMYIYANKDNYQMFLNLSEIDFPWWDRWTYDVKNAWPDLYGLPGPRTLDIYQGFVATWQYNGDLMDKAGLDPQEDVKTWDDLLKWMDEGTKWANSEPEVDYFWNQGWHNWVFGLFYADTIPLAFPDAQRERQVECYLGQRKFNDPDSPFRHYFEFFKTANDNGWIPESMWTRLWEGDMEASYIAGKSVMMLHGPWVWDKAMAAGSEFDQRGLPATPPAEGQETWIQGALAPQIDAQYFIRAGVEKLPEWEQVLTAWNWFFSPEAIPMRAQAEGRWPLYRLDEPLDLKGPQFQAVLKEIGRPGGKWEDAKFEESLTGAAMAAPYRLKGSKGVWDWESNGNNAYWADLLTGKITVQDVLDMAQANWEESYEGLPA
jgi:ABC-type glycerol-3-phosphate transport system substrate-binding protein